MNAWDIAWHAHGHCGLVGDLGDGKLDRPLTQERAELEAMTMNRTDSYSWFHMAVPLPWTGPID